PRRCADTSRSTMRTRGIVSNDITAQSVTRAVRGSACSGRLLVEVGRLRVCGSSWLQTLASMDFTWRTWCRDTGDVEAQAKVFPRGEVDSTHADRHGRNRTAKFSWIDDLQTAPVGRRDARYKPSHRDGRQ